jgi:hypothetical protein
MSDIDITMDTIREDEFCHSEYSKKEKQYVEIYRDPFASESDPREFDNLGVMACAHKKYSLGDVQIDGDWLAYLNGEGLKESDIAVQLPLWLYDHSGITMSCGERRYPYDDQWDSGLVGIIYVTKQKLMEEFSVKKITKKLLDKAEAILRREVNTYDHHLTGDMYAYTLYDAVKCTQDFNCKHEHQLAKHICIKEAVEENVGGYLSEDDILVDLKFKKEKSEKLKLMELLN